MVKYVIAVRGNGTTCIALARLGFRVHCYSNLKGSQIGTGNMKRRLHRAGTARLEEILRAV